MMKNGKWSNNYSECIKCKRTKVKHQGHGYCIACYNANRLMTIPKCKEKHKIAVAKYQSAHQNRIKNYAIEYYRENKERFKEYRRAYHLRKKAERL